MFKIFISSLLVASVLSAEKPQHAHRIVYQNAPQASQYSHQQASVPSYDIPSEQAFVTKTQNAQKFRASIPDLSGQAAYQPQTVVYQQPQTLGYQHHQAQPELVYHAAPIVEFETPQSAEYQVPQGLSYQPAGQGFDYQPAVSQHHEQAYQSAPAYSQETTVQYNPTQIVNHEQTYVNHATGPAVYEQQEAQQEQHGQHHGHHEQKKHEGYNNPEDVHAEAKETDSIMKPGGAYAYGFESTNGIAKKEQGVAGHAVQGVSQHYTPEGELVTLEYTADENGFHAQGSHIPTPPPLPDHVIKTLEWNAAHPEEEDEDKQREWDNDQGQDYHHQDNHYNNDDHHHKYNTEQKDQYHGKHTDEYHGKHHDNYHGKHHYTKDHHKH